MTVRRLTLEGPPKRQPPTPDAPIILALAPRACDPAGRMATKDRPTIRRCDADDHYGRFFLGFGLTRTG